MDDIILAKKLRSKGRITISGKLFKAFQRAKIKGLIRNGVFRVKKYDFTKYGSIRIFKSRIINEIKSKGNNFSYEKSRIIIQGYSNDGKKIMLTQFFTIQRTS
jgi:hypothetical protein